MHRLIPSFTPQRSRLSQQKIDFVKTETLPRYAISSFSDIQNYKNVNLEIGAGFGDTTIHLAKNNPNSTFIACEVYIDAISSICNKIIAENLINVWIYAGDARDLIKHIPDGFLHNIYILFPDPWPKTRHNKRRIVNPEFLKNISRVLHTNGTCLIATDHNDYKTHICKTIENQNFMQLVEKSEKEPSWWVRTKYQEKAIAEDRDSVFFTLKKAEQAE